MESGTKNWFFNRQSDQFMCCNGKLHSKTASLLIALSGSCLCMGLFLIISLQQQFVLMKHYLIYIYLLLFIIAFILLIVAIRLEKHILLMPYIAFSVLNVFFCIIIMFLSLWTLTSGKSTPSKYLAENMKEDDGVKDILKQYLNGDEIDRDLHQKVTVLLACFTLATAVIAMTAFLYSSRVVYQCYQYFEAHQKAKRMAEAISEIERSHEI